MRFLLCVLLAVLAGCATGPTHHQLGYAAMNRGDLQTAERELTLAIRDGDYTAWNNLGVLYARERKNKAAIDAYTMGARYGDPTARANLAENHLPIPAADLVGKTSFSNDGLAAIVDGLNRGYNGGSVSCTSFGDSDLRRINCR